MKLKVGDKAPNFHALDQDTHKHSLSSYKGKWVVLYFYPKDNTPGCTKEACSIRDTYSKLSSLCTVIGVSPDSHTSHAKFANKHQLPFILLEDKSKDIVKAYSVYGAKRFMGREYQGVFRTTYIIDPKGNIAKIYPKVSPAKHGQELLKDLTILSNKFNE